MSCVNPPLLAKPSRGYGWTCAPCSRRHEEEVDNHEGLRQLAPSQPKVIKTNAPAVRGRGRPRKDRQLAEKEEALEVKHFKMWPFRYFGCAQIGWLVRGTVLTGVAAGCTPSRKTRLVSAPAGWVWLRGANSGCRPGRPDFPTCCYARGPQVPGCRSLRAGLRASSECCR